MTASTIALHSACSTEAGSATQARTISSPALESAKTRTVQRQTQYPALGNHSGTNSQCCDAGRGIRKQRTLLGLAFALAFLAGLWNFACRAADAPPVILRHFCQFETDDWSVWNPQPVPLPEISTPSPSLDKTIEHTGTNSRRRQKFSGYFSAEDAIHFNISSELSSRDLVVHNETIGFWYGINGQVQVEVWVKDIPNTQPVLKVSAKISGQTELRSDELYSPDLEAEVNNLGLSLTLNTPLSDSINRDLVYGLEPVGGEETATGISPEFPEQRYKKLGTYSYYSRVHTHSGPYGPYSVQAAASLDVDISAKPSSKITVQGSADLNFGNVGMRKTEVRSLTFACSGLVPATVALSGKSLFKIAVGDERFENPDAFRNDLQFHLQPGQTFKVDVAFTPDMTVVNQFVQDSIKITSDAAIKPDSIRVSGFANPPYPTGFLLEPEIIYLREMQAGSLEPKFATLVSIESSSGIVEDLIDNVEVHEILIYGGDVDQIGTKLQGDVPISVRGIPGVVESGLYSTYAIEYRHPYWDPKRRKPIQHEGIEYNMKKKFVFYKPSLLEDLDPFLSANRLYLRDGHGTENFRYPLDHDREIKIKQYYVYSTTWMVDGQGGRYYEKLGEDTITKGIRTKHALSVPYVEVYVGSAGANHTEIWHPSYFGSQVRIFPAAQNAGAFSPLLKAAGRNPGRVEMDFSWLILGDSVQTAPFALGPWEDVVETTNSVDYSRTVDPREDSRFFRLHSPLPNAVGLTLQNEVSDAGRIVGWHSLGASSTGVVLQRKVGLGDWGALLTDAVSPGGFLDAGKFDTNVIVSYRVFATNAFGSTSYSLTNSFLGGQLLDVAIPAPGVADTLAQDSSGSTGGKLAIQWSWLGGNAGLVEWVRVERRPIQAPPDYSESGWTTVAMLPGPAAGYIDTNAQPGVWYQYRVAALNGFYTASPGPASIYLNTAQGALVANAAPARSAPRFASNGGVSVAIRPDGTLWAWGDNRNGGVGDRSTTSRPSPVEIGASLKKSWLSVGAGLAHKMALATDGTLWAWGFNGMGQLGDGTTTDRLSPSPVEQLSDRKWVGVECGRFHTLGLALDGTVWAWGQNRFGQLGDGTTLDRSKPVRLAQPADKKWKTICAGPDHNLALATDGTLWAWGSNNSGQLGDGTQTDRHTPVAVSALPNRKWIALAAGTQHSLALADDGSLWGWGRPALLGVDAKDPFLAPRPVATQPNRKFNAVTAGFYGSAALAEDGSLWGWGYISGGDGSDSYPLEPVVLAAPLANSWLAVRAGPDDTMALATDGTLWGWGKNDYGQLGDGTTVSSTTFPSPVKIAMQSAQSLTDIVAGTGQSYALAADGTLWAWGFWAWGDNRLTTPTLVEPASAWATVSSRGGSTLATRKDGSLWAWGGNNSAQLGEGGFNRRPLPVPAATNLGNIWAAASIGGSEGSSSFGFSLALARDGSLWAWGDDSFGQLADGAKPWQQPRLAPVASAATVGKKWAFVSAGSGFAAAMATDSTLWTWGENPYGQLGNGKAQYGSSETVPQPVQANSTWRSVSSGGGFALGVRSDGTLWGWGINGVGQLGNGSTANSATPVQIASGMNKVWSDVKAGSAHAMALATDGSVWTWGSNTYGQLGDGTKSERHAPVQAAAGLGKKWSKIGVGYDHSLALASDGTLWAWGNNELGQLGLGGWRRVLGGAVWGVPRQ